MSLAFPILSWTMVAGALIVGLVFGSFLNVCIARMPAHQSIVTPRSRCMSCGEQIRAMDNVPIASWVWLRGRCRACRAPISMRYPLVEFCTAILFAACLFHTGVGWETLVDAVTCFFLLGLAVMDAETMLLPDSFTLSGIVVALILKVCAPGIHSRWHAAWKTVEDAAIAAGLLLLVWLIYWLVRRRHGIGMGDVKLLAMMAAFLGLPLALFSCFIGVLAAALFAIVLLLLGRIKGTDRIPFGSFLAGAGIFAIFAGRPLLAWYLAFFRL